MKNFIRIFIIKAEVIESTENTFHNWEHRKEEEKKVDDYSEFGLV
jgi:hypothetical protein